MNNENVKRICYCDMDGVLADFDAGFFEISHQNSDSVSDEELWSIISAHGKIKFFSELPWMPGGKQLWKFITDNFLQVKILSATGKTDKVDKETSRGKTAWLLSNIPSLRAEDIIFVDNKHKKRHYSKPVDIIIDDTPIVIEEWLKKGGVGILHKDTSDTINQLRKYV